jgi:DivIVA domain-containing protein
MDVSPKTLREVEFREKMRGYHPEDVDHFLEEVASGLEVLQDRLRQAVDRAQRAEAAAAEAEGSDETLRKTLVLAQRTADMAVQEAREQAARILAGAEQQAQSILADAEERGRRIHEDAITQGRAELTALETARAQSQQDVDTLNRWLEEHKTHFKETLTEAIAVVDRAGVLWPAPSTRPADYPGAPVARPVPAPDFPGAPVARPVPAPGPPPAPQPNDAGPETAMWSPADDDRFDSAAAHIEAPPAGPASGGARPEPPVVEASNPSNNQALDDFFDDEEDLGEERRLTSRLRRRR